MIDSEVRSEAKKTRFRVTSNLSSSLLHKIVEFVNAASFKPPCVV